MSTASGWNLTGRLALAHFGALGDRVAEAIANFDPLTATQADRDQLADTLRQSATKLAGARISFDKEHADVVSLLKLITDDSKVFDTLAERLAAGTVKESAVTLFCDELEANKGRLPTEVEEETAAKEYMDQLQQIVDSLSKQLSEFDRNAKAAIQALATATAAKDLQAMKQQNQAQLDGLSGLKTHTTALDALSRRAQKVTIEANGMKIITEINQKPIDDAAEVAALRNSISSPNQGESVMDRLKRMSAESKPTA
jgi:hypothetical protein